MYPLISLLQIPFYIHSGCYSAAPFDEQQMGKNETKQRNGYRRFGCAKIEFRSRFEMRDVTFCDENST